MNLKELFITFGFKVDTKALDDLQKSVESITYGLVGLGGSAGGSVLALYELAHTTAESREQMLHMSESVGMNIESFSKLAAAAKIGGMDIEEFGMSFTMLNRQLFKASQGNYESQKAFHDMGLSMGQLAGSGFKVEKVLALVAHRFKDLKAGPREIAAMTEVFGRAGAKMIPFLKRLEEFQRIGEEVGVGITQKQAEESEEFMHSLAIFGLILKGIKNTVAGELIPKFTELAKSTNQWLLANQKIIKSNFLGFAKALSGYLSDVFTVAKNVASAFMDLVKGFGGAESATRGFLDAIGVLSAISTLFGIGKLIQGVWALVGAFFSLDAAAFAIPLAIGLVAAAIALMAEDAYQYFSEGNPNSITAILANKWPNALNILVGLFRILKQVVLYLVDAMFQVWDVMKGIWNWVANSKFGDFMGKIFSSETAGRVGQVLNNVADVAQDLRKGSQPGLYPGYQPTTLPGANGQFNVQAPITVNVPPGTPPHAVAGAVKDGVHSGIESHLRTTRRQMAPGVAH